MNILWLSHNLPYPPHGGVRQRNFNLLREIGANNKVWLLAFNQKSLTPSASQIRDAKQALAKFCEYVDVVPIISDTSKLERYKLVCGSYFSTDPYTVNWLKSDEMHSKVRQITNKVRFDVAHFDTIGLAEYRPDVGDAPAVLNHHNVESLMMKRRAEKEKNPLKKLYFYAEARKLKCYEKTQTPNFVLNLAVSELDRDRLMSFLCNEKVEIAVVPNGVDIEFFRPSKGNVVPNSLVFAGGMGWYPNRDAMLFFCKHVWPFLKKEYMNATFIIIGPNPPRKIMRLSNKDPKLKATGYVDDVRPFIKKAEVYVCPIRDGGGTKVKILDALAMGKAIVSTSIACEGIDVVAEHNILIGDTPLEVISQIKRIMEDSELRARLETGARKLAEEKFSWRRIGGHYNNLLSRVIETRPLR